MKVLEMVMRNLVAGAGFAALAACGGDGGAEAKSAGATAPVADAASVVAEAATPTPVAEPTVDLSGAPSGVYAVDQGHRYITFSYDHQGYSSPFVRWRNWNGELTWSAENPSASAVAVTIDVASIDTGVDKFDEHMRSADIFDTAAHPSITFESTAIEVTGPATGKIAGDLTIKGVTKPVVLDATFNKAAFDERSKMHKIGFSARTALKRSDFGVDYAVPFVGDDVDVIIEAEFQGVPKE